MNFIRIFVILFIPFLIFSLLIPAGTAAKGPEGKGGEETKNKTHGNSANANKNQGSGNGGHDQTNPGNQIHGNNKPIANPSPQTTIHHDPPAYNHITPVKQEQPKQDNQSAQETPKNLNHNPITHRSTQIHLHLNQCNRSATNVYVQWNGKWIPMSNQGNSPLYKLLDGGQYVKDEITAFKLFFGNSEHIYPIQEIRVGVEAEGTINYWLDQCAAPQTGDESKPVPGSSNLPSNPPNDEGKEKPSVPPKETATAQVQQTSAGEEKDVKPSVKPIDNHKTKQVVSSGQLPKTGESSPIGFYLAGLVIAAIGVYFWKTSKAGKP